MSVNNAYGQFYFGGNMDDATDGDTCQVSTVNNRL